MKKAAKIFVVGDRSIVGSALIQHFESNGFNDIISESVCGLDLMDQGSVRRFFKTERPGEIVSYNMQVNYIHMAMIIPSKYSVSEVVGRLKGQTASRLRKKFGWLKKVYWKENVVWSPGYFV